MQTKTPRKRPKTVVTPDGITTLAGQQMQQMMASFKKESKRARLEDEGPPKKRAKHTIVRDGNGEIVYPIVVNSSLQIQNLGVVDYKRPFYHKETNHFQIGFQSLREQGSVANPGERCQYLCEIKDGGSKPLYSVTPLDDQANAIVKDSSTGCWIEICKKINEQGGNKRQNVTVSGPERFGLTDPHVIQMLQALPNAEKCQKFQMRV